MRTYELTSEEAAEIAARYGLTLSDAVALRLLADDLKGAERIAGAFAAAASKATTRPQPEGAR